MKTAGGETAPAFAGERKAVRALPRALQHPQKGAPALRVPVPACTHPTEHAGHWPFKLDL